MTCSSFRTQPTRFIGPLWLGVIAVGLGAMAYAEERGPRTVWRSPSSALFRPSADLVALHQSLSIRCRLEECEVASRYHVRSGATLLQGLEFISPQMSAIGVVVNGEPVDRLVSVPLKPNEYTWVSVVPRRPSKGKLHKARFEAALRKGDNIIELRHKQRMSAEERDFGNFSDGRMIQTFHYELWPLKDWRLDAQFKLTVNASFRRGMLSWWKRNFGSYTNMVCVFEGEGPVVSFRSKEKEKDLTWSAVLGTELPDRLVCSVGDDDLL